LKNEQELVFFDLETTGLDQASDQIIEIGAVKVRGGKEVGRFEQFCRLKEGARLPEFISALTGITPLDLEPAEPVDQVVDEFLAFAGGSPLLAHNSGFDAGFLRRALGGQLPNTVYDTLELARVFFPDLQSHSLVALVDSLEIKKEEAHRALGDSLSLFRFYRKLKDKIAQSELPAAITQRLQYLFPAAAELGLLETSSVQEAPCQELPGLENVFSSLDLSRLPHLKALRPGVASRDPFQESEILASGRDVLLQCGPASLRSRYLRDLEGLQCASAILLRAPSAIEPLLEDAQPDDRRSLWISQESPNNLVCLMLLDSASQSPTMRREFGFELSALLVYEWETRSVFIPAMPLFLKKSRLVNHVSAAHCQLDSDCPFRTVCPVSESLARARIARFHVTDLAEAPHVFRELGDATPVLVSSPETEKLMSDALDVPEIQVTSVMLRIIAGIAREHCATAGMANVAELATQAGTLLDKLYQRVVREENPGIHGRIAIGENIWSAAEFAALRDVADGMSEVFGNASEGLPATMRAAYLTQSRELAALVDNVGNPDYAVWMERQGQETVLASTRTVLSSRIRACNASAQFFLAGTSVCPAGDQRFLPETFGLGASEPPAIVIEAEGDRPRVPTFVTLHLPKPNESGFEKSSSRLIAETMRRFPGKAMVASNSLETLRRMQSFLAREPGLADYGLLLPKNGHTRSQLLAQFAGQDRAILLIPFDYLSFGDIVPAKFLFVTKLQFPNSFLPTVARLKQALKERRGDTFRQFDLPYALTLLQYTLHQMDPRVLKTVFMLDNRSFSSAYADRIRTVLPTPSQFLPMESQESLLQHLDRWIRNQTL